MPLDTNVLYYGDNLGLLRDSAKFPDESVDLVYLDPPFNSNRDYNVIFTDKAGKSSEAEIVAFEDSWHWGEEAQRTYEWLVQTALNEGQVPTEVSRLVGAFHAGIGTNDVLAYLVMMTPRLLELHRVLKPTGSIYLHCDPAASHYLKIVMDAIFGAQNFRREVIWRSGWVSGFKTRAKNWIRNHDVLLYYAKEWGEDTYFDKDKAYVPHGPDYKRRGGGENPKGVAIDDVWDDVELYSPWIKSFSKEKLGYRTQKPRALLKRIIEVSCPSDGIVLDPFCGGGTTVAAAHALGRKWVGIDLTHLAIAVMRSRLQDEFDLTEIDVVGEPEDVDGARALVEMGDGRYQFQWWAISRIKFFPRGGKKKKGADDGIDGEISFVEADEARRAIASVKSGKVGVKDIRDLITARDHAGAELAVFLTLEKPTGPMEAAATKDGFFHSETWGKDYPRTQIVTVEELFEGKQPSLPPLHTPHAEAQKQEAANPDQATLDV